MPISRAQELLGWIQSEIAKLPPDSCLPTDKELAVDWGLSTITVQRLLAKLRDQGKVVRIPGKGTFTPGTGKPGLSALKTKPDTSRESSVEHLAQGLIRLISEGAYRRGNALPPVKFIRGQFKVSSETVTATYQLLEQLGYVEKIGKSYWVGRLDTLIQDSGRQEVFFFRFGEGDFRDIFQSDPIALAFQKMERELQSYGWFLHPESADNLDQLAQEWDEKRRWPAALLFHGMEEEHIPRLERFFGKYPKLRSRTVVYGVKGDLSGFTRRVPVLSRSNMDTNVARAIAHTLLNQGFREANFCFDEAERLGRLRFHWIYKIGLAVKSVNPDFVIRFIVKPAPGSGHSGPFFRSTNPKYQAYLESKYPTVRLSSLEENIIFTENMLETCARFPAAKIWLFSTDTMAAEALEWLRRKNIRVPEDISLVGFQNDPRFYHLGISTCSADWEQMGYVMAHALIGDLKLARSTRGFIKVRCLMVDKLTTLPLSERAGRDPRK